MSLASSEGCHAAELKVNPMHRRTIDRSQPPAAAQADECRPE
jgi:hypothetical protein